MTLAACAAIVGTGIVLFLVYFALDTLLRRMGL